MNLSQDKFGHFIEIKTKLKRKYLGQLLFCKFPFFFAKNEQNTFTTRIFSFTNLPDPKIRCGMVIKLTDYLLNPRIGTGKTRTLVAAIEEIIRSTPGTVLVCANSNAACDEITERLLNVLPYGEMFRMYAKSYNIRKISDQIKPVCNFHDGTLRTPTLEFLSRFRVIVCTLPTTGCLARARHELPRHGRRRHNNRYFERQIVNSIRFSHIIIDECASTHETEAMIPIAGERLK